MGAFYVLESSRSKEKSGTGLGLAIVKSILERHGFEYGVSSIDGEIQFYKCEKGLMKILVLFAALEISDIGRITIIFKIDVLNGELANVLLSLNSRSSQENVIFT